MKIKIKKSGMLISIWVIFIALMAASLVFIIIGSIDPRDEETKREEKLEELMESKQFNACMRVVEKIYAENTFDVSDIQSIKYVTCYISRDHVSASTNDALITVYLDQYTKYYFYYYHLLSDFPNIKVVRQDQLSLYITKTDEIVMEYNGDELELMISEVIRNGTD